MRAEKRRGTSGRTAGGGLGTGGGVNRRRAAADRTMRVLCKEKTEAITKTNGTGASFSLSLSFGISKGRHFLDWRDSREGGRLLEGEELWLRGHFTVGTSSTTQKGGEAYFWELSNKRREERRFYSNGQAVKAEKRGEMAREFEMRRMVKERQICRGKTIIVWTDKRQGMVLVGATLKMIN